MPEQMMTSSLFVNWFFVVLLAFTGVYCMLVARNILRLLIGVEVLSKACVLALISSGYALGNINMAQVLAITMIVVEVVVVAVGLSLIIRLYTQAGTIDIWKLNRLKG